VDLLKGEVEIVVPEHRVEEVVKAVMEATRTGEIGDAKISMTLIEEAIGIRIGGKGGKSTIDITVYKDGIRNPCKTTW